VILLSEIKDNKRKIVFILTSQPSGKLEHKDLYRLLGIDEDAFNHAIQLLLSEFSIEKVQFEKYGKSVIEYGVTKSGIENYDLQETRDSVADPRYVPIKDSQYKTVAKQETKKMLVKQDSIKKIKRRQRTICICGIIMTLLIIAAVVVYLLLEVL
jgi:hypothetical protein